MMTYTVTNMSPVMVDGKIYQEGDSIPSLTEEQAAPLLELGVISEAPAKVAKKDA
jgi:hypothetical protein